MSGDDATQRVAVAVNNPFKLAVAVLGIVALAGLCAIGRISGEVTVPAIVGIVMYVLGNGIAAKRGQVADPVVAPAPAPPEPPSSPALPSTMPTGYGD